MIRVNSLLASPPMEEGLEESSRIKSVRYRYFSFFILTAKTESGLISPIGNISRSPGPLGHKRKMLIVIGYCLLSDD